MRRFMPSLWQTSLRECSHRLAIAITVLGLAGCASPHGFLEPVAATAPGTSQVEMVVATTRTRAGSPAEMFSGGRNVAPSFADIIVSIPPTVPAKSATFNGHSKFPAILRRIS